MSELEQKLSENLGAFLLDFKEDVVKGLQNYLLLNNNLSFETI